MFHAEREATIGERRTLMRASKTLRRLALSLFGLGCGAFLGHAISAIMEPFYGTTAFSAGQTILFAFLGFCLFFYGFRNTVAVWTDAGDLLSGSKNDRREGDEAGDDET